MDQEAERGANTLELVGVSLNKAPQRRLDSISFPFRKERRQLLVLVGSHFFNDPLADVVEKSHAVVMVYLDDDVLWSSWAAEQIRQVEILLSVVSHGFKDPERQLFLGGLEVISFDYEMT